MGRPVTSFQILAQRPDETARFYTQLFDWTVNADNPLGYRMIDTGSKNGIQGGIWPSPPEARPFVQLIVDVDDVAKYIERAKQLGAQVIVPAQKLPRGEEMAVLLDVEGLPFVLFRPVAAA
jgi:predicted enzyme related to lactoylglutathione lyase